MEKKGPFQEIEIQQPEMIGEFAIVNKFSAMVTDAKDQAVYNAIIDAAKKAGINSLLLMDRRFVLNALEVAIKRQETFDSCSKAPTIEAEPVVHCKDCKSFKEYTPEFKASAECVEGADGDCITRLLYSDAHPQFSAVKKCDYCSFGAKMDLEG